MLAGPPSCFGVFPRLSFGAFPGALRLGFGKIPSTSRRGFRLNGPLPPAR
jgi:hypothetical protein